MRVINFPQDTSVGKILIGERYESNDWNEAIEAKGEIKIPENKYLRFWLGPRLSITDLKFLDSIKENDIEEFLAASTYFSDSNTEKILHLSNLDSLQLWETKITDKTLEQISNFSKLRVLGLDSTHITDFGLSYLSELPALESLSIYCNDITNKGIPHLIDLNLKDLDLSFTHINDRSIEFLKQMSKLNYLRIFNTEITESGFFELEKSLPNCTIRFREGKDS